jgi:uncharacterized coiled-coil DUF342 family protein
MTDADPAVALHFARNGSPEGHRVDALETQIAALKEIVAKAKAGIERTRQKADALSKQVAEQSAANGTLRAELDKLHAKINATWERECQNLL